MQLAVPPLEYQFEDVTPNSSIVYMLRTTQQHHVQLSMMADQKANFLIAASFVMLTVMFTQFQSGSAPLTLITLAAFTLPAAIFAVVTVFPRSDSGVTGFNPLFFGTFARMTPEGFMEEMRGIMTSDEQVYRAMAIDIYQMGVLLHRKKYRYLRLSYRIFLLGLVATPVVAALDYLGVIVR
ncbi:MAG: DUF5706 domain-containing protein [Gammaproteobacteria bacterium]|nr:DUF5706 domain-containing protein [Gammaproteobacteria bacterium]